MNLTPMSDVTMTSETFDSLLDASFFLGMTVEQFQTPVTLLMVSLLPSLGDQRIDNPTVTIPLTQAMSLALLGSKLLELGLQIAPDTKDEPKVIALQEALVQIRDALFITADTAGCDMSPVEYMRPK